MLHFITDVRKRTEQTLETVAGAIEGGVDWLQIRDKSAAALDLYEFARNVLTKWPNAHGSGIIVNDRVDVALALDLQGVHLARKSLPPHEVRRLLRPGQLMGVSVHSLEEAIQAERDGADYVTYGHIFPTSSKPGLPHRGTKPLRAMVERLNIPVLAIGGIDVDNVADVVNTGCAGIVVISAIGSKTDAKRAARELKEAMLRASGVPKHPWPTLAGKGDSR